MKQFLDRSQWLEPQNLRDYQESRLRALVDHAYRHVPYYHQLLESCKLVPADIRTIEDLRKIPVLTKQTVRAQAPRLRARNRYLYFPRPYRTSGSTGTPLVIDLDRPSNIVEFATYWWHWSWAGYRLGDRFLAIRIENFLRPRYRPAIWRWDPRLRCLYLSALRFGPTEVERCKEVIQRFRPRFLKCRPTMLNIFARTLKRSGIDSLRFEAVFTGGVNLLPKDVELAREVFHAPVYDSYGLMERVVNIRQCHYGNYHVNMIYGIVEVLDERDEPVRPGGRGRIVATGLHNWAMPLIRYDTRDLCTLEHHSLCPCGRKLPLVSSICGLAEDPIITRDGRLLTGLGTLFKDAWGIQMGQIVQTALDHIEIRVVPDVSYHDLDGQVLLSELRRRVGDGIDLRLLLVDEIEPTEEGKFKWVRCEVKGAQEDSLDFAAQTPVEY